MPTEETRRVVDALYEAVLSGNGEGMLALMSDDVEMKFLGQGTFHGIPASRRFLRFSVSLLRNVDFRIGPVIVDGDVAAAVWNETAETADGKPWENHGVDVIHVRDGRIIKLHENNDVTLVKKHFPPYVDSGDAA